MLYTSGKCIARLSASGMSCTVLAMAYIVARVRVCAPETESRIWTNIDYVANRLAVRAIQSGLASLGAVPLHIALSAFFIAFSMTRDGGDMASNATMVSFTSVLALSLAQCAANAAPTPTTMMLASLSTIATLAAMRTKWDWPGSLQLSQKLLPLVPLQPILCSSSAHRASDLRNSFPQLSPLLSSFHEQARWRALASAPHGPRTCSGRAPCTSPTGTRYWFTPCVTVCNTMTGF